VQDDLQGFGVCRHHNELRDALLRVLVALLAPFRSCL
jgi:hypothetical protein